MTDQERDPDAGGADGAADDTEPATGPDEDLEEVEEPGEDEDLEEPEEAPAPVRRGAIAAPAPARRERGRPQLRAAPAAPPSVSEQAVRVEDRASALFVIAMVALFVGILLYGILLGHAGLLTGLMATPTPAPTASPVASASAAASESPLVSESPAASGSPIVSAPPPASPAASGSPGGSPSSSAPSPSAS